MRIGFFTYGMAGERMTGIARYTVELTRALKATQDLDIILLNPYPESDHAWYQEFEAYAVPSLKLLPLAATAGNLLLHRASEQLALDVLHDPCGIAPFLAPKGSYKRVTTVHDAVPLIYPATQPLLTRLVFQTLVRASGRTADAIVTVSQASAADLHTYLNIPKHKLVVTPLGVRPATPVATLPIGQRPYFLYVGALHPRKNLPRVLEAFARVRTSHDIRLIVVGPPSWGANDVLKAVLSQTGEDVEFTGFVSDAALATLYANALALVFPSLYEGFGLPALEAMSHATAVITSNVSSLPEVVGDTALCIPPTSVEAIAKAMTDLVLNPALRERLGESGRKRSQNFTWEETAAHTANLYKRLVA